VISPIDVTESGLDVLDLRGYVRTPRGLLGGRLHILATTATLAMRST
jgi:hypothetical protein